MANKEKQFCLNVNKESKEERLYRFVKSFPWITHHVNLIRRKRLFAFSSNDFDSGPELNLMDGDNL